MKLSRLLVVCSLIFVIIGCGYRPSAYYAKKELKGKVFVNLLLNLEDPRNIVLIKDAMNEILVHRLGEKIVDDASKADTIMNLELKSASISAVQEDVDGYGEVYKATVNIAVSYKNSENSGSFTVTGSDEFTTESDSDGVITDTSRYEGIKEASSKAMEEVISKLAINSLKK